MLIITRAVSIFCLVNYSCKHIAENLYTIFKMSAIFFNFLSLNKTALQLII